MPALLLVLCASLAGPRASAHLVPTLPSPLREGRWSADALEQGPDLAIERGRAYLVVRGERGRLLRPDERVPRARRGYLSVPAGSRARLSWAGRASVLVDGPTDLEWRAGGCDLLVLGSLELEVRERPFEVSLPDPWLARAGVGAYSFHAEAGATEVGVRAGETLHLVPRTARERARPPLLLGSGASLRLDDGLVAPSRGDALASASGWTRVSWPWGGSTIALHDAAPRRESAPPPRAQTRTPRASVPEPEPESESEPESGSWASFDPEPEATLEPAASAAAAASDAPAEEAATDERAAPVALTVEPALAAAPVREATSEPARASSEELPRGDPPPASAEALFAEHETGAEPASVQAAASAELEPPRPSPAPALLEEPAAPRRPFLPSDWRGFEREALEAFAFGMLERVDGLAWTPLGEGLWKLSLATSASGPAWLLCAERDLHLRPGSSITLDEAGHLRGYQGSVRILPAPSERPRTEELVPYVPRSAAGMPSSER